MTHSIKAGTDSDLLFSNTQRWYRANIDSGNFHCNLLYREPSPSSWCFPASFKFMITISNKSANCSRSFAFPGLTDLNQDISESEFYGDLVYRFRKIVGKSNFSEQFRKLINHYKRIGYSLDIMWQTACLVVNPIIVDGYASIFNCTTAVRASDSMTASS